jgi:exopolyphosphatase / guanosine-5'-triphosphate,3'-diphosphate pyrophosphatase
MNKQTIAAIDIGSSSIRLTIAEVIDKKINILEDLRQAIRLGKDSFYKEKISRPTINDCIIILKKYKKLCDEYKTTKIQASATTAVREAVNSEFFADNIKTFTGIDIDILSINKETELIYKALTKYLDDNNKKIKDGEYQAIVEVGAGNIEVTIFEKEAILFSNSMPIGALKIKQLFNKYYAKDINFMKFLKATIENELRAFKKDIKLSNITAIYGIGSEIEILKEILRTEGKKDSEIRKKDLEKLCVKTENLTEEELIHSLDISYDQSETFAAAAVIFNEITTFFKCENIIIPPISLRDGLIADMVIKEQPKKFYSRLEHQLVTSSITIGRSMNFDEKHARKIMDYTLKFFDFTLDIHNLGNLERCYLIVASLLHDVGISISNRSHHKHSMYIISAQDFFHFNDNDKTIIANVARYHRRSVPRNTHIEYMKLNRDDRMKVSKLSSILRIADSLDNTNLQLIESISITRNDNGVVIHGKSKSRAYAEIYSFNYKKQLFEEIFGISVSLKITGTGNG